MIRRAHSWPPGGTRAWGRPLDLAERLRNTLRMGRLRNGWRLAKASWRVLASERELLAIPAVAGLLALVVFAAVSVPGLLLLGGGSGEGDAATTWALWIVLAIAAVGATWVSVIGQAAVISGAGQRMDGTEVTLTAALAGARGRAGRLFEWAVLATVVAIVLDLVRERLGAAGRILGSLGNMAFGVMSFLALPVIVFEDVGAIEGFKRSARLLRGTWGERVGFTFSIGFVGFLAAVPGIALAGGLAVTDVAALQIAGGIVGGLWVLAVLVVMSALSAVYKAALYRYTRGQRVDVAFAPGDLSGAFRSRSRRQRGDAAPAGNSAATPGSAPADRPASGPSAPPTAGP